MIAVCGSTDPDTEPKPPQTAIMETVGGYLTLRVLRTMSGELCLSGGDTQIGEYGAPP